MSIKSTLIEINEELKDILKTGFNFTVSDTTLVPHYDDNGLTFENGVTKKGKTIETCMMYIDIRKSTELSNKHKKDTMGKLYTAFVKSMIYAADLHNGFVRNIIGDRVMIVFPSKDCFNNAVKCAITCNTISSKLINKHFKLNEFSCGIGIDYGEMMVLKIGVPKQGKESSTYKNLVWVGKPANIASKLTDQANKQTTKQVVKLNFEPKFNFKNNQIENLNTVEKVDVSTFFEKAKWDFKNKKISYNERSICSYDLVEESISSSPILMTKKVFDEYKKNNPNNNDIKEGFWKKQSIEIKQYSDEIYGGDVHWKAINEIKI